MNGLPHILGTDHPDMVREEGGVVVAVPPSIIEIGGRPHVTRHCDAMVIAAHEGRVMVVIGDRLASLPCGAAYLVTMAPDQARGMAASLVAVAQALEAEASTAADAALAKAARAAGGAA